jgi:release factor glutamine methyltransferase
VLWDVCTGSGCIGIAIKKALPALRVILSDISPDALALAKENALHNNVEVELRQGDLLAPFTGEKADFIVSNPPYIAEGEYSGLEPHVKDFEPKLAFVSGKTGLECYEKLIQAIPAHTTPGARIWFEIGSTQGQSLKTLLPTAKILQDLSQNDRYLVWSDSLQ